jgi:acetolactate synthase small subunit
VTANIDKTAGGREALENAATMAGTDLSLQITAAWQPYKAQTAMVEIVVQGTGYLANFVKFRKMVKNMPGVDDIQLKEILPNQAVMIVDYQGSARSLADALILNPYDAFGINIFEVSDKTIKLELIPG